MAQQCPSCKRKFKILHNHLRQSPICRTVTKNLTLATNQYYAERLKRKIADAQSIASTNCDPISRTAQHNNLSASSSCSLFDTTHYTRYQTDDGFENTNIDGTDDLGNVFDDNSNEDVLAVDTEVADNADMPGVFFPENNMPFTDYAIPADATHIPTLPRLKERSVRHFFSRQERFVACLMDLLDFANCPLYLLDEIVKIVQRHAKEGLNFANTTIPSRKAFLRHMDHKFDCPKPTTTLIPLEYKSYSPDDDGGIDKFASVLKYDFTEQMADLMADAHVFGDLRNFKGTIDPSHPFSCKPHPAKEPYFIDEVVDGEWYRQTYQQVLSLHTGEVPFFICPVIFYIDKTGTDVNQRYPLEPLLFTTAVLNRSARNLGSSWRVLGYVPNLQQSSSATKTADRGSELGRGRATRSYHSCLREILESYISAQGYIKPCFGYVRIGSQIQFMRMYYPFAFCIGDAVSGDMLCGRYGGYQRVSRISRCCNASFLQADDPDLECIPVAAAQYHDPSVSYLREMGVLPELSPTTAANRNHRKQQLMAHRIFLHNSSQHAHVSAFYDVNFGSNQNGINGASPNDMMHLFLLGIIPKCMEVYLSVFTPSEKAHLDYLIDQCHKHHRSSERKNFPRCSFHKGITNLSLITADEWMGVVFSMALVIMSSAGMKLLEKMTNRRIPHADGALAEDDDAIARAPGAGDASNPEQRKRSRRKRKNKKDPPDTDAVLSCTPLQLLSLLEMFLCFHAWYKRGAPHTMDSLRQRGTGASFAIVAMLRLVKARLPRIDGNGWKLQKFHELLHLPRDMLMYGSPANYDTAPGEHMLIQYAKDPSKNTQKRELSYLQQINARLVEKAIINRALLSMDGRHYRSYRECEQERRRKSGFNDGAASADEDEVNADDDVSSTLIGNAKYFFCTDENGVVSGGWYGTSGRSGKVRYRRYFDSLCPSVTEWFRREVGVTGVSRGTTFGEEGIVDCWTEYQRNQKIFRAHPNYASNGGWYDWVMVRFDTGNPLLGTDKSQTKGNEKSVADSCGFYGEGFFPSRILCIFRTRGSDEVLALIHSCMESDHSCDSVIMERWELEYEEYYDNAERRRHYRPLLHCVSVDSFGERIFVMEDLPRRWSISTEDVEINEGFPKVTLVLPRDDHWTKQFV